MNDSDDSEWISFHVFYAANANPFLATAVGPLIARLRSDALITKWFFIRYWIEGPHIRLRLLPTPGAADRVRSIAEESIAIFLEKRPALYEDDRDASGDLYKSMFLAEYGEPVWNETYGENGSMPFRANNSVHEIEYEREFTRYGGAAAIVLAESHFEFSSDEILVTLHDTNVHLRTILLGQAVQQTLLLCYSVLKSNEAVAAFLERYRKMWETAYSEPSDSQHDKFDASFERMRTDFVRRAEHIRDVANKGSDVDAIPTELRWVDHAETLRTQLEQLHDKGSMDFGGRQIDDFEDALSVLLSSFVHMSNNRLGASILDEVYIAYVTCKAIEAMGSRVGANH